MSESKAAEGVHASAAPELPLLRGITKTAALSSAEGSSLGLPAGFTAILEVQPLRSVTEAAPLRQVQNNNVDLPGIGQEYLLAAQQLASAAARAPQLQSPRSSSLLTDRLPEEESPGTLELPTASTPLEERYRTSPRAELLLIGQSPFSPKGPQSTHGSSVGMGSPYPLLGDALRQHQSGGSANPRQGSSSPALGSRLAVAQTTRQFIRARAAAAKSPGVFPGGLAQPVSAQPRVVDSSYLLSTPAEIWLDVTNIQPQSKHGVASSPDPERTIQSDGSSIPSLSAPGIQGREAPPTSHLSAGIRREMETLHAKALASVPPLSTLDSQGGAPVTTGIRRDIALPLLGSSSEGNRTYRIV